MLEKTDLTYRQQAKKAVEKVNAGVFTMSAFVDALSLQKEAVRRVDRSLKDKHYTNKPPGDH